MTNAGKNITRQINLTLSSGVCFVLKKPSTKQTPLLGSGYLQRYALKLF